MCEAGIHKKRPRKMSRNEDTPKAYKMFYSFPSFSVRIFSSILLVYFLLNK